MHITRCKLQQNFGKSRVVTKPGTSFIFRDPGTNSLLENVGKSDAPRLQVARARRGTHDLHDVVITDLDLVVVPARLAANQDAESWVLGPDAVGPSEQRRAGFIAPVARNDKALQQWKMMFDVVEPPLARHRAGASEADGLQLWT